jgi:hypothetical protein
VRICRGSPVDLGVSGLVFLLGEFEPDGEFELREPDLQSGVEELVPPGFLDRQGRCNVAARGVAEPVWEIANSLWCPAAQVA